MPGPSRENPTPSEQSLARIRPTLPWTWIVAVALLFTLLNTWKPLVIDDSIYVIYARQIVEQPSDPYGFEVQWGLRPTPAMDVVVPLALPYWIAGAMTIVGESAAGWKFLLFPFALLLAWALALLFNRFASGFEKPLLLVTVFSPALLPSFNLMLDVPALSLSLAALAVTVGGCESDRSPRAVLAGLLAGVAMQTKYTALTAPVALVLYAVFAGRLRWGLIAVGVALAFFSTWEALLYANYGVSHFLRGAEQLAAIPALVTPGDRAIGLASLLGAVAPAQLLLVLLARKARAPTFLAAQAGIAIVFAALAALPQPGEPHHVIHTASLGSDHPELVLCFGLGLAVIWALGRCSLSLVPAARGSGEAQLASRFLLAWLLTELGAYFVLGPYLAARRVIPIFVVGMFLCGRALARSGVPRSRDWRLTATLATSLALAAVFAIADASDGQARRRAVSLAANAIAARSDDPGAEAVWSRGQWGTLFYAEAAGFQPVIRGRSRMRQGDWLVDFTASFGAPMRLPAGSLKRVAQLETKSSWPWSTIPSFYGGAAPLRRQPEAQQRLVVYRLRRDAIPR
jgi:hypothetical protein